MSEVTFRYFVATGERAEQVAADGLENANAIRRLRRELLAELDADAFFEYRQRPPMAVAYKGELAEHKPGFLPPELHPDGNERWTCYRPDRRTKLGKSLANRMNGLGEFDFSAFVVGEFGAYRDTIGTDQGRGVLFQSVAGYMNKTLVFKIPCGGQAKDFTPPADMREIKKSEFISLTEEAGS